jgi:hypothetical protein
VTGSTWHRPGNGSRRYRATGSTPTQPAPIRSDAVNLAEQTAARLERAGITWDDPGLAAIADNNREAVLRAELAALKAGQAAPRDDCQWKSCPVHWWLWHERHAAA